MTRQSSNTETVQRQLRKLRDNLDVLEGIGEVSVEQLRSDPIVRAATERLLQVLVDLAININAHILVAETSRAPQTGRESFLRLADLGVLPVGLAEQLAPSAGLRNVLVHQYVDIDIEMVVLSIGRALDEYPRYVRAVADHLSGGT